MDDVTFLSVNFHVIVRFRDFPMEIMEEVNEMVNAVKTVALSSGKETETEAFLGDVFNSLPGRK